MTLAAGSKRPQRVPPPRRRCRAASLERLDRPPAAAAANKDDRARVSRKPRGLADCHTVMVGLDRRHSLKMRTAAQLCTPGSGADEDVTYRTDEWSDNGNSGNRTLDQRAASAIEPDCAGRCGAVTW